MGGGGVMPRPFLLHGNSRKVFHGFRWIEYLEIEKLSKRVDNITSVTVFIMSLKFCACVQVHSSGLASIGNIIQDPYLLHGNGLTHFDFCGTGCELFASTGYGQW